MQTWKRGSLEEVNWCPAGKAKNQWILQNVCWSAVSKSQDFVQLQACSHHTPTIVQLSSLSLVSVQTAWSFDSWTQPRVSCRQNTILLRLWQDVKGDLGLEFRGNSGKIIYFLTLTLHNSTFTNVMHGFLTQHLQKRVMLIRWTKWNREIKRGNFLVPPCARCLILARKPACALLSVNTFMTHWAWKWRTKNPAVTD